MNEQLKKLAEESGMEWDTHTWCWLANPPHLERFAEMVRADEREICARLCLAPIQYGRVENNSATIVGGGKFSRQKTYTECYKAIKERGLK